jgi:hypothetical protein
VIPEFDLGDVLPPFMGGDVVGAIHPRSPYIATMSELVARFATSPERAAILRGYKQLRDELRSLGFCQGFQWVDGSFVEHCERVKGRPPGDVDIVSVVHRPINHENDVAWLNFVNQHSNTYFDPDYCKAVYSCDAYFIDLNIYPKNITEQSAYWFGLFSHQRDSFRWKGIVQVDIQCDDEIAMRNLDVIEAAGW